MKLNIRRDDTGAPETDEWLAMNGWFAELRDDGSAEPTAAPGRAEPPGGGIPRPETAAAPPARQPAVSAKVSALAVVRALPG